MKNVITTLILLLLFMNCIAEDPKPKNNARSILPVKEEKLNEVKLVSDITPELWQKMTLPPDDRQELERRRKIDYALGYYLYPLGGYNIIIDYVSLEISATCHGITLTAQSTNDKLTKEQKYILNTADLGSDINIKIKYKYKTRKEENAESKILNGDITITVVPEIEAEFPGGFPQVTEYLTENVINKTSEKNATEKIRRAAVKFTVDEEGKVTDAKIFRTSSDPKIDKLLLDTINKMPQWKPAKNSKGLKVKQEFTVALGVGC